MISTFTDIASDALTDIGMLGIGQAASPEQIAQAMRFANRMIAKWNTQRLMLYWVGQFPYVLTAFQQDYTLGPTGGIAAPRPVFVESAQIQGPGSKQSLPLSLLDKSKWGAIRDKGATCSLPDGLPQDVWIEYSYPNLAFHLWTIPSNACSIILAAWQQLQQFATPFDQINFPDGYEECLVKNLAVALAPAYDQAVSQTLYNEAADGLQKLMAINSQSLGGALGEAQALQTPNQVLPPQALAGGTAAPTPGGQ